MKRSLFVLLMLLMSMSMAAQKAQYKQKKSSRSVYYVVVGSFSSFQEASSYNNNGPYDTTCGNVYKATVNGKVVYRVCDGCFYSKAKAQRRLNEVSSLYKENRSATPWIWTNKGQAICVERGTGNDGSTFSTNPQ